MRRCFYLPFLTFCGFFFALHAFGADLLQEGERLFLENKPKEASIVLEQSLRTNSNEKAWLYLGIAYQQLGKTEDAIGAFRKGLALQGPFRHLFLYNIGNCYFSQEKNTFAEDLYGQAILEKGDYAEAYLNRANVRIRLGLTQNAISDYSIYLELLPANPQADMIRRLLVLLNDEVSTLEATKLAEETRRLAEAAAKQALLDSLAQSLRDSSSDTTNISGGTDGPQAYSDDPVLED